MKLNRIFLIAAASALMAGAAQAQPEASVNLSAKVTSKCSFYGSGDASDSKRSVNFGDITEVTGRVVESLSGSTAGPLKLSCTSAAKGKLTFESERDGYLTQGGSGKNLDENQRIAYTINVGARTEVDLTLTGGPKTVDWQPADKPSINLFFAIRGGKEFDGSYRYLAGTYADVVTVSFTPGA